jgi:predicted RNA-binding protein (virulence factor B family)
MIQLGKVNNLKIIRDTEAGLYLGDGSGDEVLLPKSRLDGIYRVKDSLDVFVYTDGESRHIASTRKPIAELNSFAFLRVRDVADAGAFMDWGLEKDLFVPYGEQKRTFERDRYYVVYIYLDEVSQRIVGSSKLDKFLVTEDPKPEGGSEVEVLLYEESDLGFSCIINGKHKGLIYHNDIFQDVFVGEELTAYIKTVREDGLIDVSLQKSGFKNVLNATDVVQTYLEQHEGFLDLHDKSSPEDISRRLGMSKATFKKAIGILYRHRKILIKPDGVYLLDSGGIREEEERR